MSIVPPASATLIWAFPTEYEEVRCFVWEHSPAGWSIAIMFGEETLALEVAPTRWAMEAGVDLVWRGLLSSGLGHSARARKMLDAMSGPETGHPSNDASSATSTSPDASPRVLPPPMPRAFPRGTFPPRFEDPFCPHTPFRHNEPEPETADSESSDPSPRRRPH
jgi:hypothetical protein